MYIGFKKPPPFYENRDDVHCMECTMRSIISHFEPHNNLSADDIDRITQKVSGKWSWPQFSILEMLNRGYDVQHISLLADPYIVAHGFENYLTKIQGPEAAKISIENSVDIKKIEAASAAIVNDGRIQYITKIPHIDDIKSLLSDGYLVHSILNARSLNKREGYAGHAVLIYGIDENYVYFHDSGLPAVKERKEEISFFVDCCKNPKEANWFITGYKND